MSNFRTIDRDTAFLFPPSVDEWLPQRHLARYVVEVVETLELSEMVKAYRGSGSASYHPAMLLSLLICGRRVHRPNSCDTLRSQRSARTAGERGA